MFQRHILRKKELYKIISNSNILGWIAILLCTFIYINYGKNIGYIIWYFIVFNIVRNYTYIF